FIFGESRQPYAPVILTENEGMGSLATLAISPACPDARKAAQLQILRYSQDFACGLPLPALRDRSRPQSGSTSIARNQNTLRSQVVFLLRGAQWPARQFWERSF